VNPPIKNKACECSESKKTLSSAPNPKKPASRRWFTINIHQPPGIFGAQLTPSFIAAARTGHSHPQQYQGIRRGHIGVVRRSDAEDVEVQQTRRRHGRKRAKIVGFGVSLLIFVDCL